MSKVGDEVALRAQEALNRSRTMALHELGRAGRVNVPEPEEDEDALVLIVARALDIPAWELASERIQAPRGSKDWELGQRTLGELTRQARIAINTVREFDSD